MDQGFIVLHELRLAAGDVATRLHTAEQMADMPQARDEQVLPLLVSIDDRRDVACVRRVRALPEVGDEAGERIHAALRPEPESSGPPRYYRERAAISDERGIQSYYRMAVTESGTNDRVRTVADMAGPQSVPPLPQPHEDAEPGSLWIGTPLASETGLLVITGHHDATAYADGDPGEWPLRMSRDLGVRIYESARP